MFRVIPGSAGDKDASELLELLADGLAKVIDRRMLRVLERMRRLEDRVTSLEATMDEYDSLLARDQLPPAYRRSETIPEAGQQLPLHPIPFRRLEPRVIADAMRRIREGVEIEVIAEDLKTTPEALVEDIQTLVETVGRLKRSARRNAAL